MQLRIFAALLLSFGLQGQGIVTIPTNGTTDTATSCSGIFVDGGGLNGNYGNYNNGYLIIDPPGTSPVSLTFSSFSTASSSDYIYVWDGIGTSGTFIGYYYGSSLPNGGSAITSTSGAITVRFYSNYASTSSGFVCSWATTGTTAPTANFTTTSTSISYNTPLQFVNTSQNAGSYVWDFGDGTTSTDQYPIHSFTSSGTKIVTLIATNCYSSDTTSMNITVANAPNGAISNDSLVIDIPCGTTASQSLTLSNATSAGNLTLSTELIDTNYIFKADFEDGTLETFSSTSTLVTLTNTSTVTNTGSGALMMSGYYNNSQTVNATFPNAQPSRASYATKVNSGQGGSGYTWFSGDQNASLGYSPFGYSYWYTNGLRLVYRSSNGYTTTHYEYTTSNEFVNIEYDNIDWTTKTFDIIIDGVTIATGAQFYYNLNSGVNGIHGYQYSSSYVHYLDDIEVQGGNAVNVAQNPTSATVAGGNNVVMNFTVDATGLFVGSYFLELALTSNDTVLNGMKIPVIVNVTGEGVWASNYSSCLSISGYSGAITNDTLKLWNTGCDTLRVTGVSGSSTRVTVGNAAFNIAPEDTVYVPYAWSAGSAGTYNDSIVFQEQDSTYTHCIAATVQDAASIGLDSTTFNISYTGCPDSLLIPFWLYNDGQQTLNWGTSPVGMSITEDFEAGTMNTSLWSYFGSGANIQSSTYGCGSISGSYSLHFYGGIRYAATVPLNLLNGGTVSFEMDQGNCDNAESSEGIYLQYSTNGSIWYNIQYFYTYSSMTASATIPAAAMTNSTQLRLYQQSYSGSSYDAWIVDDFEVDAGLGTNLSFSPDTGNTSVSDSELVNLIIYTDSLQEGLHTFQGYINSNDPVDSTIYLTVNLTLDGESETYVDRGSCFDLDTIVKNSSIVDSILVENLGCDSLYFNALSTSNSILTATNTTSQMYVGDSAWVVVTISPIATGAINDTVYISTSDTVWPVCYTGYVAEAPAAWVNTAPLTLSTQNCGDSVNFTFNLGNTATNTNLNWSASSNPVLNVVVVNQNVYPSLLSNLQNYLGTVSNISVKTVTSISAMISELAWADVVIFPPITNNSSSTDYTAVQSDLEDWIEDGGKMIVMGSTDVGNILAMNWISGYYYGNYTGYTHYVNTTYSNHPYIQGVSSSFVTQSASLDAYIYNTGLIYLVYNTYYRQALSYLPMGDGEFIYYGFNFNSVYSEITTMMDNILESTLANKDQGPNWIRMQPNSGTTSGGDTTTVSGTAYSDSLTAGTHELTITITTNDPSNSSFSIPVTFTVNGLGETAVETACTAWDSVYQNMNHIQDVPFYNVGCDTLTLTGTATGTTVFSAASPSLKIAPGDTGYIPVTLNSSTLGSISDQLSIYTNADTITHCLSGVIVGASDISVTPSSITVTVNKCNSFTTVPYTITNNGSAALSYEVSVAEVYDSSSTQNWLYPAPNYSNTQVHTFNNIIDSDTLFYDIILNGEYSVTNNYFYLYANGSYVQTLYDNNVTNYTNDTISGFLTGTQLTNIVNTGYLTIQLYSYNYTYAAGQTCTVEVRQKDPVTWASPVGLTSGSVAAGNSVTKSLLVTVSNLAVGTYNTSVLFETNDPQDPLFQVPMTVNVVSEPDMVLGTNAVNYGNIYNTTPVIDSVLVSNDGCTDLSITNVASNNAHFAPNWTSKTIAAGASSWLNVTFTATTATQQTGIVTITNNDSIQYVNLAANVIFAPDADYQYQVQNACNGEVSFINESTNGSQYFWAFGDGTFSAAVNPTHNYSKPGTYQVMLVTSNAGGSDTLFKNVVLNDILYVASEFPDTVQAGTTVQFIDSSMYANSWQWYFGDGGNATSPNPQHTYANKGTYIVTLLVANSAGCSASDNNAIIVTSGIGVDENLAIELTLYPNPTQGFVEIESSAKVLRMELYSPAGQLVYEGPFDTKLDLSSYPAGTYQLVFRGDEFVVRRSVGILH